MKLHLAALLGAMLLTSPLQAERLKFDHRLSPQLKALFDSGDPGMIDFNDSNPRYVTDLIAIEGKSAKDWTEALLIVARAPDKKVRRISDWVSELQDESQRRCASQFRSVRCNTPRNRASSATQVSSKLQAIKHNQKSGHFGAGCTRPKPSANPNAASTVSGNTGQKPRR